MVWKRLDPVSSRPAITVITALADALDAGRAPPAEVAELAAGALRCWLEGGCVTLDHAFAVGAISAQRQRLARTEKRDRLLAEIWRRHFPGLSSGAAAAREIESIGTRYETSGWQRGDRDSWQCPPQLADTAYALIHQILEIDGHAPSARTIRRALAKFSE